MAKLKQTSLEIQSGDWKILLDCFNSSTGALFSLSGGLDSIGTTIQGQTISTFVKYPNGNFYKRFLASNGQLEIYDYDEDIGGIIHISPANGLTWKDLSNEPKTPWSSAQLTPKKYVDDSIDALATTVPTSLASLTGDVNISTPKVGQPLVYDGTKWTNTNTITASSQSVTPLILQGTVSQLSPLFDIKNNLGTSLFTVSNSGTLTAGTVPVARVSGLATVATTGSYTDLSNKPSIPTSLDALADVAIANPQNGQLLVYYAAGGYFTNSPYIEGNIVIGSTSSQNATLGIKQTGAGYLLLARDASDNILLSVRADGMITTGDAADSPYNNTTGSAANVYVTSSGVLYRSTSSLRYKTDVTPATFGLAEVLQLNPVKYKTKKDGNTVFGGLIAEEVHDVGLTEFVQYDDSGNPDALAYGNMVALAFKAIQELNAKVEALEAKIAELESQ